MLILQQCTCFFVEKDAIYSLRDVKYVDAKEKHAGTFILLSVILTTVFMLQESFSLSSSL